MENWNQELPEKNGHIHGKQTVRAAENGHGLD